MEKTKKEEIMQPAQPKPNPYKGVWLPLTLIIVCIVIMILYQTGYSMVYQIQEEATIGVPYSYNLSSKLIFLMGSTSSPIPPNYSFYLGSGAGFPPAGLALSNDGILNGTPTAAGGTFEACVKDVSWAACRMFHLNVTSA